MSGLLNNADFQKYYDIIFIDASGNNRTAQVDDINNTVGVDFYNDGINNICTLDFTGSNNTPFEFDKILISTDASSGKIIFVGNNDSTVVFSGKNSGCSISSSSGVIYFKSGTYIFTNEAIFESLSTSTNSGGYYVFKDDTIINFEDTKLKIKSLDYIYISYQINSINEEEKKILEYISYIKKNNF